MKLSSTLLVSALLCAPVLAAGAPPRQAQVNAAKTDSGIPKGTQRAMLKNATRWQYDPAVRRSCMAGRGFDRSARVT